MTNSTAEPILRVSGLSTCIKGDGETFTAVDNISFDIQAGETFALVGESGSGKSITSLSIMRLLPEAANITQGEICFGGRNILKLTEAEMRSVRGCGMGIIFQEPMTSLNPVMTIGQQIGESVCRAKGKPGKAAIRKEVLELLDLVGIKDSAQRIDEYPHQFSGGMRQRVMIAIALAGEPDLLIADEPTTALDVTIQAQVLDLIKEIQQKRKMAVLLITHDLGVVRDVADHVAVMRYGKIIEAADSQTFFSNPQHPYSQCLFNALPTLAKRGKKLASSLDDKDVSTTAVTETRGEKTQDSNNIDCAQHLLTIKQLKTYFPIKKGLFKRTVGHVKAVNDVSLHVKKGKTVAIVGESGSGKTTLAKTILQLLTPSAGCIEFDGKDITQLSKPERKQLYTDLQIVFQDPYSSMNPRMRVNDILAEGMKALNTYPSSQARLQRMQELMELVGLDADSLYRYPHQFSGGQRQRIAIARALAVNPKLIICDEPTSALDVSVQAQILNLLKDLQQRLGLSYLFITHDISVVSYIADEVVVMYNGEIVEQGNVEDIILKPQHQYTKKLMSAVPSLYKA